MLLVQVCVAHHLPNPLSKNLVKTKLLISEILQVNSPSPNFDSQWLDGVAYLFKGNGKHITVSIEWDVYQLQR